MMATVQFYVSGISPDTDESAVKALVGTSVPDVSVEIVRDLDSGESRGYGVVRVPESASEVVQRLSGTSVGSGRVVLSRMPVTLPGEMDVRDWLQRHAGEVFSKVGVKIGQSVLDYGCGPGLFTVPCARIVGERGRVYALDVRPQALEQVRQKAAAAGLRNIMTLLQERDGKSIALEAGAVDAVIVFDVMQDIKDKVDLLSEIARVLKRGGLLSVFPMHIGNSPAVEAVNAGGLFVFREKFDPPNSKAPSSVLNFAKRAGY